MTTQGKPRLATRLLPAKRQRFIDFLQERLTKQRQRNSASVPGGLLETPSAPASFCGTPGFADGQPNTGLRPMNTGDCAGEVAGAEPQEQRVAIA